ncbi:MAG: undecaprenyl-diphosphate phosphatase [Candidatus Saccharibacteria bacterium]|nr:undecaprenyl-diphosphate phosphatase [Candidatus Saccharibacteria bacterium]
MALLHALLLGIIEGLTEFLPISSTGHLLVAENLIGYKDAAELFTVVIQVGAIGAIILYYRDDLLGRTLALFKRDKKAISFWKNWIIATIPAGLFGLALDKKFSTLATLPIVACALILGGFAILAVENHVASRRIKPVQPDLDSLTIKQSLQVGMYQILSLIPGVSRSGATIMGGLMSGIDRSTATAFSFYLSLPILILASGYKLIKDGDKLSQISGGSSALIVGTIAAFFSALVVVKWLLKYVAHHDFKIFAYYRISLGLLILVSLALF